MASANDLIVLFLGLEILSIALYVLAASHLPPDRVARRRASSTSCSAASPRRSSSTASPSSTAPPARTNLDEDRRRSSTTNVLARRTGCCSPASRCCWSASAFKVAAVPFHILDARRVPGRADAGHRRSWPRRRRRRRSPRCCGCSSSASPPTRDDWRPVDLGARRAHAARRLGRSPSCRPTSSGCWPTRRSATPASSWSASRRPASRRRRRHRCRRVLFYLLAYPFMVVGTLRRRHAGRPHAATATTTSTPSAAWPAAARCWPSRSPCFLLAQAGRAVHAGLPRQVLRDRRRRRRAAATRWPSSPCSPR